MELGRLLRISGVLAIVAVAWSGYCEAKMTPAVEVVGMVTAGDRPVSGLMVTLEPLPGTLAPSATAITCDGDYRVTSDAGLRGGKYVVWAATLPPDILATWPVEHASHLPDPRAVVDPRFAGRSETVWDLTIDSTNHYDLEVQFLER